MLPSIRKVHPGDVGRKRTRRERDGTGQFAEFSCPAKRNLRDGRQDGLFDLLPRSLRTRLPPRPPSPERASSYSWQLCKPSNLARWVAALHRPNSPFRAGKSHPDRVEEMLIQQLRCLEEEGVVQRTVYPQVPPKVEYRLTAIGEALRPTLHALVTWANFRRRSGEVLLNAAFSS